MQTQAMRGLQHACGLTAGLVVTSIALTPDLRDRGTYQALRAPS
jgi:hypothetical protein